MTRRDFQAGDHIHAIGYGDNDTLEPITRFDYDAVNRALGNEPDPEKPVEFSDMAAAFSLILQWVTTPQQARHIGGRALALLFYLDPTSSRFGSLAEIATASGCTKQALSKSLMELRDSAGISLTCGKRSTSRETYREAQLAAFRAGEHSAHARKDRRTR
jgi:hypothetical protein